MWYVRGRWCLDGSFVCGLVWCVGGVGVCGWMVCVDGCADGVCVGW